MLRRSNLVAVIFLTLASGLFQCAYGTYLFQGCAIDQDVNIADGIKVTLQNKGTFSSWSGASPAAARTKNAGARNPCGDIVPGNGGIPQKPDFYSGAPAAGAAAPNSFMGPFAAGKTLNAGGGAGSGLIMSNIQTKALPDETNNNSTLLTGGAKNVVKTLFSPLYLTLQQG